MTEMKDRKHEEAFNTVLSMWKMLTEWLLADVMKLVIALAEYTLLDLSSFLYQCL